jgi:uncharacterized membrane protein YccC
MARGIVGWMQAHDPEGNAGHKAVKVAISVTTGLAIGTLVVGNAQMSLFASFGGVAMLLFADFPGTRSARLGAYLGLYAAGLLLIALGTVMSHVAWVAVAGMLAVGFLILFSGVLSAALAGASRAALLAFILPVMVPVPVAEIPARWAGWTLATILSVPLAVFLWPPRDHQRLRTASAAACGALADQLSAWSAGADSAALRRAHDVAGAAITELRTQFRRSNVRPVGLPAGRRLLMGLPDRLEWLHTVVDRLPTSSDRTELQRAVVDACGAALRAAQAVLAQAPARPSFASRDELTVRLRALRQLHVASRTFARLMSNDPLPHGDDVHPATKLELVYTTRLTGLTVAASAAADARSLIDRLLGRKTSATATGEVLPVHRALTSHLSVRSVWFQNSVRGAVGLAIAVTIAEVTEVAHGFWVVLGAMSVLRTTALTTGSTALRALGGTLIGFVAGAVIMFAVGTTPWHLWLMLPIALLIAGYLPEAVSFAAGQAAFTVLVVILFNIISPSGWGVGLVRVEDVLFGCASALVSGVLLWPHGAAAQIRQAVAEFYRSAADAVVAATGRLALAAPGGATGARDAGDVAVALGQAAEASLRLDDALREYLFERGTRNVPLEALTSLSNGAGRLRMTAEAIAELPPPTSPPLEPAARAVTASADATRDWFDRLADRLHRAEPGAADAAPPLPDPVEPVAERTVVDDVRQVLGAQDDPAARQRLLADGHNLWMAALYVDNLDWVQHRLSAPAAELIGRSAGGPRPTTTPTPTPTAGAATAAGSGSTAAAGQTRPDVPDSAPNAPGR